MEYIGGGCDECEIYKDNNVIYRAIPTKPQNSRWTNTLELLRSESYQQLSDQGLVLKFVETDIDPASIPALKPKTAEHRVIFKAEYLPFQLFPINNNCYTDFHYYEILDTVGKIGQSLKSYHCDEPHWGNFIFVGAKPCLVDIGAISTRKNRLIYIKDICSKQFPPHINAQVQQLDEFNDEFWEQLINLPRKYTESNNSWDEYNKIPLTTPGNNLTKESSWILSHLKGDESILDLGCNDGNLAFQLINHGDFNICGLDTAENAIIKGLKHSKKYNYRVCFYNQDITDNSFIEQPVTKKIVNWKTFAKADCVIVSSLMHHLCKQGFGLGKQAELCNVLANELIIFEYIDKEDEHVKPWGVQWSLCELLNNLGKFELIDEFEHTSTRKWLALKRKSNENRS